METSGYSTCGYFICWCCCMKINTKYIERLKVWTLKNENKIDEKKLLIQYGPTCWIISILNNFIMNTGGKFTKSDQKKFLKYLDGKWVNTDKWWIQLISLAYFTEYWNDVLKRKPIIGYYLNDLTNKKEFSIFCRLLAKNNVFGYSRESWDWFKEDRKDGVLDQLDWKDSEKGHAVNICLDKENNRLKELGSYGDDSKYNILWINLDSFLSLLRKWDIRQSVYLIKYINENNTKGV